MRGQVCRLELLLAIASAVILGSEPRVTHDHILLSQIRDSLNLEGYVPYLYPLGTGLYPPHMEFRFRASYDSQGYGGGIRTSLHAGGTCEGLEVVDIYSLGTDRIENTIFMLLYCCRPLPNNGPVIIDVFFGRYLETDSV
jgi:hypothetical protein